MEKQKYQIDDIIIVNNRPWRIAEYRMGRGSEWLYTLSNEHTDGSFETMRVNEDAVDKLKKKE